MNANNHTKQKTVIPSADPHLINNPSTELAQRALKSRVWDNAALPNGCTSHISNTVALETLNQVGYAWAAGFLDGEGCVSLARVRRDCGNRVNYRVRVNLVQNCRETLKTFRDYVGENCVFAQLPHRESYSRPIYQLIYDGNHTRFFPAIA